MSKSLDRRVYNEDELTVNWSTRNSLTGSIDLCYTLLELLSRVKVTELVHVSSPTLP